MTSFLKYAYLFFRYPRLRCFLDMGVGIEARYNRCQSSWESHIEMAKQLQRHSLKGGSKVSNIAVLGAGRLLDIDIELLAEKFHNAKLYDGDPSALKMARKKLRAIQLDVEYKLCDLSGSLEEWRLSLVDLLSNKHYSAENVSAFLGDLTLLESPVKLWGIHTVMSLNVLSQVGIYWREIVHQLLKRYRGIVPDELGILPDPYEGGLVGSMQALEAQHLSLLNESGAERIILSTDIKFNYLKKRELAHSEPALFFDPLEKLNNFTPYYTLEWTWDISPQGVENFDMGTQHEVRGWGLVRKGTA